jgi:TfoX/Sxy family transcriptional regulator of competence genes
MAYNDKLADMVRELISEKHKNVEEKAMFGGLCFMVNDKMCVGVNKGRIMVRFDPAMNDEIMEKEGARPMEFTGRTMKGFAFVDEKVLTTKKKLEPWVKLALDYNKFAKSSKKKSAKKKK